MQSVEEDQEEDKEENEDKDDDDDEDDEEPKRKVTWSVSVESGNCMYCFLLSLFSYF